MMRIQLSAELFLRSINLRYDAEHPERIAHFQPTAKSVLFLQALAGEDEERAFFVVAPYGSGKSITATYLLHFIENRLDSSDILRVIEQRFRQVSPALGQFAAKRRIRKKHGLVLALHAYYPSLAKGIKSAVLEAMTRVRLGRQAKTIYRMPCDDIEQAIVLLAEVRQKVRSAGFDRILILWDEFGRHLESLLTEGRSMALIDIQMLAEFVARSKELPMTLGLLLHRELLNYAGNIPQSVRAEWTKIEGRFQTIQYIDDSKETYRLISEVVSSRASVEHPTAATISSATTECKRLGLFTDFTRGELEELLKRSYPFEPTTLYLLPRLSARVAQNERTLFSFLYSTELRAPIGPDSLYDYFSPTMRSDTTIGGTYRQWLETQSALTKVGSEGAARALKIACLLGLGTDGERSRASRDLLRFALHGYESASGEQTVIDQLIEQKLLLHRRYSDEVSVWHGTDVDLRRRLEEEKYEQREHFKLVDFLARENPPSTWRPVEYNDDFCVRRYLSGEYHNLDTLTAYLNFELPLQNIPVDSDGKVLYVIAETAEYLRHAEELACNHLHDRRISERIILAIPREPLPLFEAALEVACLLRMQLDGDLVGSDPLVVPELQQMTDDARAHLQQLIDRVVRPSLNGPRWFYCGNELKALNSRDLQKELSNIMREVYYLTPKINNEMIVRHKPSPAIINARKKLLLGILERSGKNDLGIEGNFPDASMFRTVLLHTGLYYQESENSRWRYASPDSLQDPGLKAVWTKIQQFLTKPAATPKDLRAFFNELMEPPFGVRAGLLPIFFAAGMKAFPSALSLTKGGTYVTDILPSEIEQLCREPELYRLMVLDLDQAKHTYLHEFYKCFSPALAIEIPETDLIRMCFDVLENWKTQLPEAVLSTKRVSERTRLFQAVLRQQTDPVQLLFDKIPLACGFSIEQCDRLLEAIVHCKKELMSVIASYHNYAAASVRRALALDRQDTNLDVRGTALQWANCFSEDFVENMPDGIARGLLSRVRMPYNSDASLLESLSSLLVGKSLTRWDDSTIAAFDREIQNVARRVEEAALLLSGNVSDQKVAARGLVTLVRGRITQLLNRFVHLVGAQEAEATLSSLLVDCLERSRCGDDQGSYR